MMDSTLQKKTMQGRNKSRNANFTLLFYFLFVLCLGDIVSCRLYMMEKKLKPADREFLSKVRYIITREERKIFLELADSEKEEFKEEFWTRRDPDPATEENEFKEEYFRRIEEANQLFRGGVPGWLQDRGRIYILIGPPTERYIYPIEAHSKPREIWYYGTFPVIFIDEMGIGDYQLQTLDVVHLLEINKAQYASQEKARPKENYFDFVVKTQKTEENEMLVSIEIDFRDIWFTGDKGRLETTIVLALELWNEQGEVVIAETKDYPIVMLEEDVGEETKFVIEYPLVLKKGTYTLDLDVLNKAGNERRTKSLKIDV